MGLFSWIYRRKLMRNLERFADYAEKRLPLGDTVEEFPDTPIGKQLNRLEAVYRQTITERTVYDTAKELLAKESQDNIRAKKQLTQNINHELKTPVSCISGYLETIINNPNLSPEQRDDFIRKSYEQSQRISSLLADLSMITRLDEASELVEKERISLSNLISNSVGDMEAVAGKGGIRIINNFPEGKNIIGSQFFLYAIFRNLFENAIAYSKGTKVTIDLLKETSSEYAICVADDGVGVEKEHLTRVFERFYRVDKGRSRSLGGTGLGLSIVKNSVLLHQGTIQASMASPSGLTFIFTLAKVS